MMRKPHPKSLNIIETIYSRGQQTQNEGTSNKNTGTTKDHLTRYLPNYDFIFISIEYKFEVTSNMVAAICYNAAKQFNDMSFIYLFFQL